MASLENGNHHRTRVRQERNILRDISRSRRLRRDAAAGVFHELWRDEPFKRAGIVLSRQIAEGNPPGLAGVNGRRIKQESEQEKTRDESSPRCSEDRFKFAADQRSILSA